jgi:hypothetical protein
MGDILVIPTEVAYPELIAESTILWAVLNSERPCS